MAASVSMGPRAEAVRQNGSEGREFPAPAVATGVEKTAGPAGKGSPTAWQGGSLETESSRGGWKIGEPSRPSYQVTRRCVRT
jgi:hypothetical protein